MPKYILEGFRDLRALPVRIPFEAKNDQNAATHAKRTATAESLLRSKLFRVEEVMVVF